MPPTSIVSPLVLIETLISSVKSSECAGARLGDADAARLGQGGRVDEVDLLLGVALEGALQHGDRQQAGVEVRERALDRHVDVVERAMLGQRHGQAAESPGQRDERLEDRHVLRSRPSGCSRRC